MPDDNSRTFNCNFIRILNPKETFSRFISFALDPHCSHSLASIMSLSSTKAEKQWQVSPYRRLHFIFAFVCRLCMSASFFWPSWPEECLCVPFVGIEFSKSSLSFATSSWMRWWDAHTTHSPCNIRFYLAIGHGLGHMLVLWVPSNVDLFYAYSLNQ